MSPAHKHSLEDQPLFNLPAAGLSTRLLPCSTWWSTLASPGKLVKWSLLWDTCCISQQAFRSCNQALHPVMLGDTHWNARSIHCQASRTAVWSGRPTHKGVHSSSCQAFKTTIQSHPPAHSQKLWLNHNWRARIAHTGDIPGAHGSGTWGNCATRLHETYST